MCVYCKLTVGINYKHLKIKKKSIQAYAALGSVAILKILLTSKLYVVSLAQPLGPPYARVTVLLAEGHGRLRRLLRDVGEERRLEAREGATAEPRHGGHLDVLVLRVPRALLLGVLLGPDSIEKLMP